MLPNLSRKRIWPLMIFFCLALKEFAAAPSLATDVDLLSKESPFRKMLEQEKKLRLLKKIKRVEIDPACGNMFHVEMNWTFPVPFKNDGKNAYRVLFYPVNVTPHHATMSTPIVFVEVPAFADKPVRCERLRPKEIKDLGPIYSAKTVNSISFNQHDLFYAKIEEVAKLYFDNRRKTKESTKTVCSFFEEFSFLMEPALGDQYRQLNPDFWKWVGMQCGKSLK